MARSARTRIDVPARRPRVRRAVLEAAGRARTVLRDRRVLAGLAAVVAVAVLAVVAGRRPVDATPRSSPVTAATSVEAAVARLTSVPDPLEAATRDVLDAVAGARTALADTTAGRGPALREARATLQLRRMELLALEDSRSDEQRAAIGAVNRQLQRLLNELDTAR